MKKWAALLLAAVLAMGMLSVSLAEAVNFKAQVMPIMEVCESVESMTESDTNRILTVIDLILELSVAEEETGHSYTFQMSGDYKMTGESYIFKRDIGVEAYILRDESAGEYIHVFYYPGTELVTDYGITASLPEITASDEYWPVDNATVWKYLKIMLSSMEN